MFIPFKAYSVLNLLSRFPSYFSVERTNCTLSTKGTVSELHTENFSPAIRASDKPVHAAKIEKPGSSLNAPSRGRLTNSEATTAQRRSNA